MQCSLTGGCQRCLFLSLHAPRLPAITADVSPSLPRRRFSAWNSGLTGVRNTPRSRALLAAWADFLTDPAREDAGDPMRRGVDDQQALNMLLDAGGKHSAAPGAHGAQGAQAGTEGSRQQQ